MPEGPEIRREADRVAKAIEGKVPSTVWFAFDHLAADADELTGRRVERVTSRGKAMLIFFAGHRVLYTHNQLYGKWIVKPAGELAKTGRQLRVQIETERRAALLYSASEIEVLDVEELDGHDYVGRLGPDPLDEDVTVDGIVERLRDSAWSGRQLAGVLLDQGFVAGLGNYLRADILHVAAIHPKCRARDLADEAIERLANEILRLPRQSYATKGITNSLDRVERLKAQGVRRSRYRHHVYNRDGRDCYRCGEMIERQTIGGRAMFFCPGCQLG